MRNWTARKFLVVVAGLTGAVLVAIFASSNASAQAPVVAIASLEAKVEALAKVEVGARELGPPGLGAWTIDVQYNPELVAVVGCSATQGGVCNPEYDEKTVRVVGTNINGLEGDAALGSIGIVCKKAGEGHLELSLEVFVNATPGDPQPIEAELEHGSVLCSEKPEPKPSETPPPEATPPGSKPKLPGDANCDHEVNSLDAVLQLQFDAGLIDSLSCKEDADYNHDGEVNALDAVLTLQKDAGLI